MIKNFISVIIPTYKRPKDLAKCLKGLEKQRRKADEVLVIIRNSDKETWNFFEDNKFLLNIKKIKINIPGQVAALNVGLNTTKGEIITITDDDCIPHKNWLELIEKHFNSDSKIGAVGGKDNLFHNNKFINGKKEKIGKITWYGGLKGYHHLGFGKPREVDHLKGANISFRKEAIKNIYFDKRLKGKGAQVRNDTSICLRLKKLEWKIVYDPNIIVDHHMAVRYEENKRGNFNWTAVEEGAYNETLVLLEYLKPLNKVAYLFYSLFIGNIFTPGIIQCLRILPREKVYALLRLFAAYKGRWEGFKIDYINKR